MTYLNEDRVIRIAQNVFRLILDLDLRPGPDPGPTKAGTRTLTASVQLSGAWEGVAHLQCTPAFAARAAGLMFGIDATKVVAEQVQDALGELANMVGGNIKALLPEPCRISLPTVVDGTGYVVRIPGREPVLRIPLQCEGESIVVLLLRKEPAPKVIT